MNIYNSIKWLFNWKHFFQPELPKVFGNIEDKNEQDKIKNVYEQFLFFLYNQSTSTTHLEKNTTNIFSPNKTFHLYEYNFPYLNLLQNIKENIICEKIKKCIYENNGDEKIKVFPITEMNEIYLSKIGGKGSDHIFETKHVDGPFFLLPYCYVYRCILALSSNKNVITHFISSNECKNEIKTKIDVYEFAAFDYNKTIHYISSDDDAATKMNEDLRVVYKLHYIVCPSFLPFPIMQFYKWLHIYYNNTMRFLFVNSQNNGSILAWIINTGNCLFLSIFTHS